MYLTLVGLAAAAVPEDSRCATGCLQQRILNSLDGEGLPGLGAWHVNRPVSLVAEEPGRLGVFATELRGEAWHGGAKLDAVLFRGDLKDLKRFGCWVFVPEAENLKRLGFQIKER